MVRASALMTDDHRSVIKLFPVRGTESQNRDRDLKVVLFHLVLRNSQRAQPPPGTPPPVSQSENSYCSRAGSPEMWLPVRWVKK